MSKRKMSHVAGACLVLLLAGATVLEAQVKPRPTTIGKPRAAAPAPAQQPAIQGAATTQLASGVMLPCCVV